MKTTITMIFFAFIAFAACVAALAHTGEQETEAQYKCVKSLEECIRAEDGSLVPYDFYN